MGHWWHCQGKLFMTSLPRRKVAYWFQQYQSHRAWSNRLDFQVNLSLSRSIPTESFKHLSGRCFELRTDTYASCLEESGGGWLGRALRPYGLHDQLSLEVPNILGNTITTTQAWAATWTSGILSTNRSHCTYSMQILRTDVGVPIFVYISAADYLRTTVTEDCEDSKAIRLITEAIQGCTRELLSRSLHWCWFTSFYSLCIGFIHAREESI